MSPSEVQALLGVSRRTLWRYRADGVIQPAHHTPKGHARFRRSDVEALRRLTTARRLTADAGYAQPTALGAGILSVAAILVGLTTPPGVALATVVAFALGRLAFLLGRAALDSERRQRGTVVVHVYPALSRAEAARAIEGWHR